MFNEICFSLKHVDKLLNLFSNSIHIKAILKLNLNYCFFVTLIYLRTYSYAITAYITL